MLKLLILMLWLRVFYFILMIWTWMIMLRTFKVSLKLMMIATSISVFLKLMITFLSHLDIFHHSSNKCSSMSKFRVFIQFTLLIFLGLKFYFEYFVQSLTWFDWWFWPWSWAVMFATFLHTAVAVFTLLSASRPKTIISCSKNGTSLKYFCWISSYCW